MTEEEAKDKWCPMSFNTPDQKDLLPCCASQCACWVWDTRDAVSGKPDKGGCGLKRR